MSYISEDRSKLEAMIYRWTLQISRDQISCRDSGRTEACPIPGDSKRPNVTRSILELLERTAMEEDKPKAESEKKDDKPKAEGEKKDDKPKAEGSKKRAAGSS